MKRFLSQIAGVLALAGIMVGAPALAQSAATVYPPALRNGYSGQGIPAQATYTVPTIGTATDRGVSVATANTAQQLMPANSSRRGFAVQNQSSGSCYISGQGTATQDYHSLLIAAGAYYETPPTHVGTGAVSIICAVSAASVYAREY